VHTQEVEDTSAGALRFTPDDPEAADRKRLDCGGVTSASSARFRSC